MKFMIFFCATFAFHAAAQVPNTNTRFCHTTTTKASPAVIWQVWTDVTNWQKWDDGLRSAQLKGAFELGTRGVLIPDKGPKAKFKITALTTGISYTFRTQLPLGALYVRRTLALTGSGTAFTHEVWFTGLTKGIFGRKLGRKYREILPSVMDNIKQIAEQ